MDQAQEAKIELEEIQRRDRRLRKAWLETGSVERVKNEKKKTGVPKSEYGVDKDEEKNTRRTKKRRAKKRCP